MMDKNWCVFFSLLAQKIIKHHLFTEHHWWCFQTSYHFLVANDYNDKIFSHCPSFKSEYASLVCVCCECEVVWRVQKMYGVGQWTRGEGINIPRWKPSKMYPLYPLNPSFKFCFIFLLYIIIFQKSYCHYLLFEFVLSVLDVDNFDTKQTTLTFLHRLSCLPWTNWRPGNIFVAEKR